jgi:hypothetical protein
MPLKTQLQGAPKPVLWLLRNPNPWHSAQPSFASAIVSERFQSKFTNGAFLVFLNKK